jgi:hypothetical protein
MVLDVQKHSVCLDRVLSRSFIPSPLYIIIFINKACDFLGLLILKRAKSWNV